MAKFDVDIFVPSNSIKLFELATDFENFNRFSPAQIKEISIVEQSDKEIITNEILTFNTIFKNVEIKQKTKHLVNYPKTITSKVIEGPFKKTVLEISFSDRVSDRNKKTAPLLKPFAEIAILPSLTLTNSPKESVHKFPL